MPGKLTDTRLRSLRATGKVQKISDGNGLYIHVSQTGGKLWRIAYRFNGKQKTLSLGAYPALSLKEARVRLDEIKSLLAEGIDPGVQKKESKANVLAIAKKQAQTFETVAREWHAKKSSGLTPNYAKQVIQRLEAFVFPFLGNRPITELKAADFLSTFQKVEARGRIEMAHRLAQMCGQVMRYARIAGIVEIDVASGLTEALTPTPIRHHATITDPKEIGVLLRAIDDYSGSLVTQYALKIMPYVFVRSVELRGAVWEEIDLSAKTWTIPAIRMKMRRPHYVPLATQVVNLFQELREISQNGTLVFPSPFSASRYLTDMGLLVALRRMGYDKNTMTIHGFRSMASTLLNEQGYRPDVIEAQLAHGERNAVRAAYNHAEYLKERRNMMQAWADYLDTLRAAAG